MENNPIDSDILLWELAASLNKGTFCDITEFRNPDIVNGFNDDVIIVPQGGTTV